MARQLTRLACLHYAPDTFGVGISLVGLVDHTLSALVASAVIRLVASSVAHSVDPRYASAWYRFARLSVV